MGVLQDFKQRNKTIRIGLFIRLFWLQCSTFIICVSSFLYFLSFLCLICEIQIIITPGRVRRECMRQGIQQSWCIISYKADSQKVVIHFLLWGLTSLQRYYPRSHGLLKCTGHHWGFSQDRGPRYPQYPYYIHRIQSFLHYQCFLSFCPFCLCLVIGKSLRI